MRKAIIGAALLATLLAVFLAPADDADVSAPAAARSGSVPGSVPGSLPGAAQRPTRGPAGADAAPAAPALAIRPRGDDDEELGNIFAGRAWHAPAVAPDPMQAPAVSHTLKPVRAVAAAASADGLPPLPIRFLGKFTDDGKTAYFLQVGERNVVARIGDKVDDNYTFDSADGDVLRFMYLPLHKTQVLAVGDTN